MRCDLCGHGFSVDRGRKACAGCPLVPSCGLVRCPNCGYETPAESRLERIIRSLRR